MADEKKTEEKPALSKVEGKEEKPTPKDNLVVTKQKVRIGGKEIKYTVTAGTMRKAMTYNPHLKVYVANGYFDLGTPYFATEYTFSHLGLDKSLQKNVSMDYYEAGHMMYIHLPSLKKMKKDLTKFIKSAM